MSGGGPAEVAEAAEAGGGRVDWGEAWRAARARSARRGSSASWDRRAPGFARHAEGSEFVERLLELMAPNPSWSLLDVGCGSGTLALPLARRGCRVTALDFSPRMLELLRARCAEERLGNVETVLGAWEDDWPALGIGRCDVALASRSLVVDDLKGALEKLHAVARRRVFLAVPVGEGPIDPRVVSAAGRTHQPGPDYRYPLGALREMGIEPAVSFIPVVQIRRFATPDEAVEGLAWMVPEPTAEESARLRAWVEAALVPCAGGLELQPARTVRWAVLSWETGGGAGAAPG